MRAADELIKVGDPRRETGVCGEVLACWVVRFINTFYTYLCNHSIFILFAYLFCLILLSIYTVEFGKAMEYVEEVPKKNTNSPKQSKKTQRYQKGRWKHQPQGISRFKKVKG